MENRPKICIYLLWLIGGAGKSAVQYANTLAQDGWQITIIASKAAPELKLSLDSQVDLRLLAVRRSIFAVPGLTRVLRKVRPDLVFSIGVSNMLPLTLAMKMTGLRCPILLREANSPAGLIGSYGRSKRLVKKIAMRDAYRRADHIICLTSAMKKELRGDWNISDDKITHIPNGVALPPIAAEPRTLTAPPTILCVARLSPQKDIPTLLRAFALLHKHRECRLQIAGDGAERPALQALAKELVIVEDVTFLGHVPDPMPLFRAAHVSVMSSIYEGFSHVLIESLAQGCPVVATDCPTGPAEVIDSDAVGYLAEVRNPEDLASKLRLALDRDFDPAALRARAEDFSLERLNARIHTVFSTQNRQR